MMKSFHMKHYNTLRKLCLGACCLTLIESVIWIGFNIVGILFYCGIIKMPYAELYFKKPVLETVLTPQQIFIWNCIYLAVNASWLIISIVILLKIKRHESKVYMAEIIIWIILTLIVCIFDLALGIIFGIDFFDIHKSESLSMMILMFKGFTLWLINVGLVIALSKQLRKMSHKCDDLVSNCVSNQTTIDANQSDQQQTYEIDPNDIISTAFNNEGFESDSNKITTPEPSTSNNVNNFNCPKINEEILIRSAHLSKEVALLEGYFRNINAYAKYPPLNQESRQSNNFKDSAVATNNMPAT